MTGSLQTLLTGLLQEQGIYKEDFNTITKAIHVALMNIEGQMKDGERVELPSGNSFVLSKVKRQVSRL